jgi:hypothetical protein
MFLQSAAESLVVGVAYGCVVERLSMWLITESRLWPQKIGHIWYWCPCESWFLSKCLLLVELGASQVRSFLLIFPWKLFCSRLRYNDEALWAAGFGGTGSEAAKGL